nr:MAG TPA: hypothetical protein [Caudoviricetes sp.]
MEGKPPGAGRAPKANKITKRPFSHGRDSDSNTTSRKP